MSQSIRKRSSLKWKNTIDFEDGVMKDLASDKPTWKPLFIGKTRFKWWIFHAPRLVYQSVPLWVLVANWWLILIDNRWLIDGLINGELLVYQRAPSCEFSELRLHCLVTEWSEWSSERNDHWSTRLNMINHQSTIIYCSLIMKWLLG